MFEFVNQHQFWAAVVVYWIFSAAVSSMPDPPAGGESGYQWLFRFLHTLAGNLTTAFGSKIPGAKMAITTLVIPFVLATPACAGAHYAVHTGSRDTLDSATYDTLLAAEATIDQARSDYQAGLLPDDMAEALETLVRAYNVARQSWLTYRGAMATDVPADAYFNQLSDDLTDLADAIRTFEGAK
jgi:hypothetical protein